MTRVLVVYATKSGCTTGVAERIGQAVAEKGAAVDVVAADKAGSAAEYDAVIVGSGVRAGAWHATAKQWVSENSTALKAKPVAFYTCGLMITQGAEKVDEVRGYTDALISESGVEPVDLGLFAGWNEPKQFAFIERSILKMMKAPEGDFRDWSAIDEWASTVAPKLGVA